MTGIEWENTLGDDELATAGTYEQMVADADDSEPVTAGPRLTTPAPDRSEVMPEQQERPAGHEDIPWLGTLAEN